MSNALEDHLIAVKADRLRPGMYVAALDRLWLHTPFPPGGFYVRDQRQIERIGRYCTWVYIDPHKSEESLDIALPFDTVPPTQLAPRNQPLSIEDELPWARQALAALNSSVQQRVREIRNGRLPELHSLQAGLLPVVDSVRRNPDALLWLLRSEPEPVYLYRRMLSSAVIATVFGERMGFDREALLELALGGLLMDIGKIEVPVPILAKADSLSAEEQGLVRKHVSHALELVRLIEDMPERVIDMVSQHHERFDGSGYPYRNRGTEIPLFARMAGIVDTFDAITQDRRYAPAISAHTALRYLNGQRRSKFDAALLQEFIHALGIYPTGTWVELLDGSVGVVCEQNPHWPLTPRVAVITHVDESRSAGYTLQPSRANPIIRARHSGGPGLRMPDLIALG